MNFHTACTQKLHLSEVTIERIFAPLFEFNTAHCLHGCLLLEAHINREFDAICYCPLATNQLKTSIYLFAIEITRLAI